MADIIHDLPRGAAASDDTPTGLRTDGTLKTTKRGAARRHHAERARTTVILCGVPEPVVQRAEGKGAVDWRALAGEIDGLWIATGGQHAVRAFWRTPHRELTGRTPLEALDSPTSVRVVADLVRERAAAVGRARFGFAT